MKSENLKKKFKIVGGVMTGIGILLMFTNLVGTGFGILCLGLILFFVGIAKAQEETKKLIIKESNSRKNLSAILLLLIIGVIGAVAIFGDENSSNTQTQQASYQKQNETLDDISVYVEAQDYVKQALKSPATADFPAQHLVNRLDNNRYEVISFVDSQNSYGATIRTNWNVVFQIQNGKKYLEKMVMNGEVVYSDQ